LEIGRKRKISDLKNFGLEILREVGLGRLPHPHKLEEGGPLPLDAVRLAHLFLEEVFEELEVNGINRFRPKFSDKTESWQNASWKRYFEGL
jgi:hypothetical protein